MIALGQCSMVRACLHHSSVATCTLGCQQADAKHVLMSFQRSHRSAPVNHHVSLPKLPAIRYGLQMIQRSDCIVFIHSLSAGELEISCGVIVQGHLGGRFNRCVRHHAANSRLLATEPDPAAMAYRARHSSRPKKVGICRCV